MNEVVRLWEGAAEQGLAPARCNLGVMYEDGRGVDVNHKRRRVVRKAARRGDAGAQHNLGIMYKRAVAWM